MFYRRVKLLSNEKLSNEKLSKHSDSRPRWLLDARPTGDQEVAGSTPVGPTTFFVEIDHEIFSMVILSLPLSLIQDRQLSVSGKRMHNAG